MKGKVYRGGSLLFGSPSSRSVRLSTRTLSRYEWKSDGQCAPIVPGIVTCGFLSVRQRFHPLASARSIFMPMIHAGPRSSCTTRCIFISISRRGATQTWLRFRWFAPPKWFNIRETSPRRAPPSVVHRRRKYYSSPSSSSNEGEEINERKGWIDFFSIFSLSFLFFSSYIFFVESITFAES